MPRATLQVIPAIPSNQPPRVTCRTCFELIVHVRIGAAAGFIAQPPQRAGSVSRLTAFGSERFLFGGAADWRRSCHSGAGGEVSQFVEDDGISCGGRV